MRGLIIEELVPTLIFTLIAVGIAFAALIYFIFTSEALADTSFRFASSLRGTSMHSGLLQYPIAGESIAEISSRLASAGSAEKASLNPKLLEYYISRLSKIFQSKTSFEKNEISITWNGIIYEQGSPPVYCGSSGTIAYCEYAGAENSGSSCSAGRTECTDPYDYSSGNCQRCRNSLVCCKEIGYDVSGSRYDTTLSSAIPYCGEGKGVCEAISCSTGRKKITAADSCIDAVSSAAPMQPLPLYGLDDPLVCCRPMQRDELKRIVKRTDVPALEVPAFSPADQKNTGGYSEKIIITYTGEE